MGPAARRRSLNEDDDDGASTDDHDASLENSVPGSSKRRRLNPAHHLDDESEGDLLPDSFRRSPRANRRNGSLEEQHQPGSLVRIHVKKFVTYEDATFNCGPSLNMIIGPNGTGKSTLVCAICLGLGYKPNVLGRAKDIGEFVKNGHREAEIEIELAGREGEPNTIIHHTIKREGNKSSWKLDGRNVTHKEVMRVVSSFSIQIDNLCQFLPQDRVVEFAQMTPVGLLESTQKAAATEEMYTWHAELKSLGAERLSRTGTFKEQAKQLENLEKRQASDKFDVDKQREREALKIKLVALNVAKPLIQYENEKAKWQEAKDKKLVCEQELGVLEEQVRPITDGVASKKHLLTELTDALKEAKGQADRWETSTDKKREACEKKKSEIDGCEKEYQQELDGNQTRKTEMVRLQRTIRALEDQLESEPASFDARSFNEQIREKEHQLRDVKRQTSEVVSSQAELKRRLEDKDQSLRRLEQNLQEMNSQAGQQLQKLKDVSEDAVKAWNWLRKNQQEFKEKVYGPVLLECSIKDARYVAAVESLFTKNDLACFTATNWDDWAKFKRICAQELRLYTINSRNCERSLEQYPPLMSQSELAQLGLDNWAIEHLEGPEPVLTMLCDVKNLNRTAITLKEQNEEQFNIVTRSVISTWVAGQQSYKITRRREYGQGAMSTQVLPIHPARYWGGSSNVDSDRAHQLRTQIQEVQRDMQDLKDENTELVRQLAGFKEQYKTLETEKMAVQKEKDTQQKAYAAWQVLPTKISTHQGKLENLAEQNRQVGERLSTITSKREALLLERAQMAIDHALALRTGLEIQAELVEIEIQMLEAESDYHRIQEKSKEILERLALRKGEIEQFSGQIKTLRDRAKAYMGQYKKANHDAEQLESGDEVREVIGEWCGTGRTLEQLEAEISSTRERISLIHGDNPRLMQQFEERGRQIEVFKTRLANHESELEQLNARIAEVRGNWEPELDRLVGRISAAFSHNFEKIGCNGEVSVRKDDDDFREWAIEIKVKFRENEDLAILDSHRQSGGERAVSTIFYLMALQSMARSPFRVVDEINQGMDPRNERMVHERMVDIACSENTSQYFLITPKLLNDLKYHERMAVHIIYSGEEMPKSDGDGGKTLDFKYLADLALRAAGKVR